MYYQNAKYQPDADGFNPRRITLGMGIGLAVLFLAAETYFALAWKDYDIRKGTLPWVFIIVSSHLCARGRPAAAGGLQGWRGKLRAGSAVALLLLGMALLVLPSPARWTTFGLGVASLAAAVAVAQLRLPHEGKPSRSVWTL